MTVPGPVRAVRRDDLVDLGFDFRGLVLRRDRSPAEVVRPADASGPGLLLVRFGPQHVIEETYRVPPRATDPLPDTPVRALVSGGSLLVYEVPPGTAIPYTLNGLLDAMGKLSLRVVDAARAAGAVHTPPPVGATVTKALRMIRAAAVSAARFGAPPVGEPAVDGPLPENPVGDPGNPRTGIELPYRLLLSPSQLSTWRHRTTPGSVNGRVELWHTTLSEAGIRAVWTRDPSFRPGEPHPPVGDPPPTEMLTSLNAKDRSDIVHLTANHRMRHNGELVVPRPADLRGLTLSALGGWLDAHGHWEPRPDGIDLIDWRHVATLGRDHFVRVMRAGFLMPFGHPAVRVEVSEREYDPARPDHPAYLRKREFVLVRDPVRVFDPDREVRSDDTPPQLLNRLFPFRQVRLLTLVTPELAEIQQFQPDKDPAEPPPLGEPLSPDKLEFFPKVPRGDARELVQFKVLATDLDGRTAEFQLPMLFVSELVNSDPARLDQVCGRYGQLNQPDGTADPRNTTDLRGQAVALAESDRTDDTKHDVGRISWNVFAPASITGDGQAVPLFTPTLYVAGARIPAMEQLSNRGSGSLVQYARRFREAGFGPANAGEVYLQLLATRDMDFNDQRDKSGGIAAPSMRVGGLSRKTGPVSVPSSTPDAGDPLEHVANGVFRPSDFFEALHAKLFGVIELADIIRGTTFDKPITVPGFISQSVNAVTGLLADLERLRAALAGLLARIPVLRQRIERVLHTGEALVTTVKDQLPPTPSPDVGKIEQALVAFQNALHDLIPRIPPGSDPGASALLLRIDEQLATWDRQVGELLSLKQSVERAVKGLQLPETLSTRLEWQPEIQPWPAADPIFAPHSDGRFTLTVDLRGSLRPDITSGADITATLERFDLRLVPPALHALTLEFERIRFQSRAGRKPDVEVVLKDVQFAGVLKFVQTLRQIIPLDGFSDPPHLTVSPSGIRAGFGMPLPNVAIGVFSLENISLDAYLDLPFVAGELEFGFAFCSRDNPFRLTVSLFGGGGFLAMKIRPTGLHMLEAALEFGAAASLDFGVASGSLSVMAGVYLNYTVGHGVTLAGYFRARGEVDVLGLISASIELYLEFRYDVPTGEIAGLARITIEIEVFMISKSVEITCEKRFRGGGATLLALDAAGTSVTFADLMGPYTDLENKQHEPVAEYCSAFAEVA